MNLASLLTATVLAFSACSSPTTGPPGPPCVATGAVSLAAKNSTYSEACLAAPAGEDFTVTFTNNDPDLHNVSIYQTKGGNVLFKGKTFAGPKQIAYRVGSIEQGTHYFQCDVHPDMNGTFIAE